VVRATLVVEAVVDDGDTLTPFPVEPLHLTTAQLATFDIDKALAPLREQVEADARPIGVVRDADTA
jgi:hypothetical protein